MSNAAHMHLKDDCHQAEKNKWKSYHTKQTSAVYCWLSFQKYNVSFYCHLRPDILCLWNYLCSVNTCEISTIHLMEIVLHIME